MVKCRCAPPKCSFVHAEPAIAAAVVLLLAQRFLESWVNLLPHDAAMLAARSYQHLSAFVIVFRDDWAPDDRDHQISRTAPSAASRVATV